MLGRRSETREAKHDVREQARAERDLGKRQELIEEASPVLLAGETILDALTGMVPVHRAGGDTERRGTLAVTDRRVFLFTKRIGGHDVQDFVYAQLTSCNYSAGLGFGSVELVTSGGQHSRVTMVGKEEGERIGQLISQQMQAHRGQPQAAPATAPDPVAQLTQLAAMHDSGALSDEEFAAAKARLLG